VKFSNLVQGIREDGNVRILASCGPDADISSIHYHAQKVLPGGVFVAIAGFKADGHDFIETAIRNGACAIVSEKELPCSLTKNISWIQTDNSRKTLAVISSHFYNDPSQSLNLIAITGTNGKTTTSYLIESILNHAGLKPGVIGTVNYRYSGKSFVNPVTTPESLELQQIMADMRNEGVSHVVMEASSHALDLHRLYGCHVKVGIFTNLTQDHLDYHKDMESYWSCKKKLFTNHLNGTAVINCNHPKGKELSQQLSSPVISVGHLSENMVWVKDCTQDLNGIRGKLMMPDDEIAFDSPLIGHHNLENILCAAGAAVALNIPSAAIRQGTNSLAHVPGRLEPVPNTVERFVYVDYAHTPDALKNVLSCLKKLAGCRVICVFGCGGDRDRGKRPIMGEIAARYADMVIVTSDNPRSEPPMSIIDQIVPGVQKVCPYEYIAEELMMGFEASGYVIEADRRRAIGLAIAISRPGDVVLIAGKGHETYQIVGDKTYPFDDKKEAGDALSLLR
jgi:UDP-N-acetylmuramoyl-L-alanyl-D-glutamate--2,6-diaminopimelate ligase/murE/murF fusion protein